MIAPTFIGMEPTAVHQQLLTPQEVAVALEDVPGDGIVQSVPFNGSRYRLRSAVYRRQPEPTVSSDPHDGADAHDTRSGFDAMPDAATSLLPDFSSYRSRLWISNLLMLLGAGSMIAAVSMLLELLRELRREA